MCAKDTLHFKAAIRNKTSLINEQLLGRLEENFGLSLGTWVLRNGQHLDDVI